jgi:hypothetical protein
MPPYPAHQKIWHITHHKNLASILQCGALWSDAKRLESKIDCSLVGMRKIKARRLTEITVDCHPGTKVGEYVPFYFCPRSVMLYILHMGNSPDLDYHGGQEPIVHLQADLRSVINWAGESGVRWAFSDRNAGAYMATFSSEEDELANLDWQAIKNPDFRSPSVKEGKQAEFLIFEAFPWRLVDTIGVHNYNVKQLVDKALAGARHRPGVSVQKGWYY